MYLLVNDAPIFVMERGQRDRLPVLFVHGFPFSHKIWLNQIEVVSRDYYAIAYDVRGHGESYVGDGQFTVEGHVDDLFSLLDAMKLPRVVVIGLSMGGYIALRALEREPDRFLAAVLCDTRSEADSSDAKLKRHANILLVKREGSEVFADRFLQAIFAEKSYVTKPDAVELVRQIIARTPPLSIAGTLLALAGRTDTTGSLSNIGIPTLILVGEHDGITPPSAAEAMHALIPHSELHVVPAAAHMSNLENPEFFNEKLLHFLRRVSQGNRTW
jgi:pimeloyl-ACP methyl ester carboxylesterase